MIRSSAQLESDDVDIRCVRLFLMVAFDVLANASLDDDPAKGCAWQSTQMSQDSECPYWMVD